MSELSLDAQLLEAAQNGDTASCMRILDQGADTVAQDKHGRTALQEAAWIGSAETCLALIDRGIEVDAQDKDGWTALHWAALKGYTETCLCLIAHGADPSRAPEGMRNLTQIEAAARGGFIPRLMTLLETADADHQALADIAVAHGQEEAAAVIRSHAARAQIKNIAKGLRHV